MRGRLMQPARRVIACPAPDAADGVTWYWEQDPRLPNLILNHPAVKPWVTHEGQGDLDVTPILANMENLCLVSEYGCFIGIHVGPFSYDVHTNLLPSCKEKREVVAHALEKLYLETPCMTAWTVVPEDNAAARMMAIAMHFKPVFVRRGYWPKNGEMRDATIYKLEFHDWLQGTGYAASGARMHEKIFSALDGAGVSGEHPDDPSHNLYVGVVSEMLRRGNHQKAEMVYNEYARVARYEPIYIGPLDGAEGYIIHAGRVIAVLIGDDIEIISGG